MEDQADVVVAEETPKATSRPKEAIHSPLPSMSASNRMHQRNVQAYYGFRIFECPVYNGQKHVGKENQNIDLESTPAALRLHKPTKYKQIIVHVIHLYT